MRMVLEFKCPRCGKYGESVLTLVRFVRGRLGHPDRIEGKRVSSVFCRFCQEMIDLMEIE